MLLLLFLLLPAGISTFPVIFIANENAKTIYAYVCMLSGQQQPVDSSQQSQPAIGNASCPQHASRPFIFIFRVACLRLRGKKQPQHCSKMKNHKQNSYNRNKNANMQSAQTQQQHLGREASATTAKKINSNCNEMKTNKRRDSVT